jgi:hypothetical protein
VPRGRVKNQFHEHSAITQTITPDSQPPMVDATNTGIRKSKATL